MTCVAGPNIYPNPPPPSPIWTPPATPNPADTCVQVTFICECSTGSPLWVLASSACVPNAGCAPTSLVYGGNYAYYEAQYGCPGGVLPSPLPMVPP